MGSDGQDFDRAAAMRWIEQCHESSEKLDMHVWTPDFLTADVRLKFFAAPFIEGRDQAEPALAAFTGQLDTMKHDIIHTDYVAPRIYHQFRVNYVPKGGDPARDTVSVDSMAIYSIRQDGTREDGTPRFRCFQMEVFGDMSEMIKVFRLG